jgi:hypothetical protein
MPAWIVDDGRQVARVWVVGRHMGLSPDGTAWEFQGVFSTERAAVAACRDHTYFVGPAEVDVEIPHETAVTWPGAFYPKAAAS